MQQIHKGVCIKSLPARPCHSAVQEALVDAVITESKPKHRDVSGVLVTRVMEFNFPSAPFWFIKHPFANKELIMDKFDLTYYYVSKNQIKKEEKSDFGKILKINNNWIDNMT